ncbi:winged helix-turn-helix transcriptional regulator [Streptomyces sp. NPDC053792]|uniref:winged helix-turn-helix transcriptional regulator n=1 Tax=Streptomyces sp. NPDC053792 TaxID=3365716 RepID=UPI0037D0058B
MTTSTFDVFDRTCRSRSTLENITGRWGALTLGALGDGPLRFNRLRRRVVGISEKMLTQTLRNLQRDGMVYRRASPANPPTVTYGLTPLGSEITTQVAAVLDVIARLTPDVLDARHHYDTRNCARPVPT